MMVAPRDRAYRSLKGLERTGATSRVLNFAAISARQAERGERLAPFFHASVLGGALIVKHRLRPEEQASFARPRYTATKVVVPFERTDLALGGRSLFIGQQGWTKTLGSLHGDPAAYPHDVAILEALDELPSLDPFLVREQLKRRHFQVAAAYFVLSPADLERMQGFVHAELEGLVRLALGGGERLSGETEKLAHAILSGESDLRLESLRGALHLEESEYGEGLFCWRGLLYYKWSLQEALPLFEEIIADLGAVRLVGRRSEAIVDQVYELKNQVANGFTRRLTQIAQQVAEYDAAFAMLRDQVDPAAFSRFLMSAPTAFRALGEDMGVLSHCSTYWRHRFPADAPLLAAPDELIDILEEYALALA
jgi:hypothetical protein